MNTSDTMNGPRSGNSGLTPVTAHFLGERVKIIIVWCFIAMSSMTPLHRESFLV
jgi:hypothetical protein